MTDGQLFIHGSEPLLKENQNTKRFCISVMKQLSLKKSMPSELVPHYCVCITFFKAKLLKEKHLGKFLFGSHLAYNGC